MLEQQLSIAEIRENLDIQLYRSGIDDFFVVKDIYETYTDDNGFRHWDIAMESPGEIPGLMDLALLELILGDAKESFSICDIDSSMDSNDRLISKEDKRMWH